MFMQRKAVIFRSELWPTTLLTVEHREDALFERLGSAEDAEPFMKSGSSRLCNDYAILRPRHRVLDHSEAAKKEPERTGNEPAQSRLVCGHFVDGAGAPAITRSIGKRPRRRGI